MPGTNLPLHIFEPRYLEMVRDVLRTHGMIGMIQPDPSRQGEPVPVYRTGCAGAVSSHQETADGRIMLWLTGVCRFDVREELPMTHPYREVVPDWTRFLGDLKSPLTMSAEQRTKVIGLLTQYFERKHLSTDWEAVGDLPDMQLIHAMATSLPLGGAEKQGILESVHSAQRVERFVSALQFGIFEVPSVPVQ